MKDTVQLEATYPHPPERVWKALTESDKLSRWLMPNDFRPLIGYRFRLETPAGAIVKGKVIEVEDQALIAFTWNDEDDGESVVVWRLEPVDGGTRVSVEHRPVETPEVTRIPIDAYFNWRYALRHRLPGLLALLRGVERHSSAGFQPVPQVISCR
jgi:uncharacterized protein YndB with AHSA1/START domain